VAKPKYKVGDVIWARVADRNGIVKSEPRPLLVMLTHPTEKRADLFCLAISTRTGADPADPYVVMPWDEKTGSTTGLFTWCAVVLFWPVFVPQANVVRVSGSVSLDFVATISRQVEEERLRWRNVRG
jgi:hypothetical protein